MRIRLLLKLICTISVLSVHVLGGAPFVCAEIEPTFLMDTEPKLEVPEPIQNFDPALSSLWMTALERSEADMQRMAAETIARGHQLGMSDLTQAIPRLETILVSESSHPTARYAAARALIVLESRGSSEKLFNASQTHGSDLRQLIEPALAGWDYDPARAIWIERLSVTKTRPRELVLALRGLAQLREQSALPEILAIATDLSREPDLRLAAATAAGEIADSGLEGDAQRLAADARTPLFVNQLCAIRLLARHQSSASERLLVELAAHPEPLVAGSALERLNEIDPALVVPLATTAIESTDVHVRQQGARAMLKLPEVDRIPSLSQLLADPHPDLRREVCEGLAQLSEQPEFDEPIREAALQILAGDRWQGHEQAALLLGTLEHQPAADRLVELLESTRVEVMIAAAWALRHVAVEATIPALLDKARRETERRQQETSPGIDEQIAHVFEALGVLNAQDAMPLLVQYIPKRKAMGERSRSAAIWALGRLNEETRDAELENAFNDRITDFPEKNPEYDLVKAMCAIALARMNAVEEAPMMREIVESEVLALPLGVALRWAVNDLTGEELPPPAPLSVGQEDWFLVPLP